MGTQDLVLFRGTDANLKFGLWETDGTSGNTWEVSIPGADMLAGPNPSNFVAVRNEVFFEAFDGGDNLRLWVSDGTSPGTSVVSAPGAHFSIPIPGTITVLGNEVLFVAGNSSNQNVLWVTDGTSTSQIPGSSGAGAHLTVFGSDVLYTAFANNRSGLWKTDGTTVSEITVNDAASSGVNPSGIAILGSEAVFSGTDSSGQFGLWTTNGTTANEFYQFTGITPFISPSDFTTLGNKVLFRGSDFGLWVTDGTAAGTSELNPQHKGPGAFLLDAPDFTVLGNIALFEGLDDNSQPRRALWVTDGTEAGTKELTPITGSDTTSGIFATAPPNFMLFGTEALFSGRDSQGLTNLWVTDGTAAGTHEIPVAGSGTRDGFEPGPGVAFTQSLIQPALSNIPPADGYTERNVPVTLAPAAHPNDTNSSTLESATVAITGGTFANDGDMLSAVTTGTSITANYDAASETLTLTGTDTLADYQQVLQSVTFSNPSHNPINYGLDPTRTITWSVDDGQPANNVAAPQTTILTITAVNDPPVLSGVASSANFMEGNAAVTLPSAVTISDLDNLTLSGAMVTITAGKFTGDGDVLAATTAGTSIVASYNSGTETLSLTGTDTFAHYQQVLDSVSFASTSKNPTNYGADPTRTLNWVLNDGGASNNLSAPQTTTVNVTAVNDPPFLAVAANAVFSTGHALTLSPFLFVGDPDSLTLASATVAITGGTFPGDGDVLAANATGTGISATYDADTETLTLLGVDTLGHYQAVLESVAFSSTAVDPAAAGAHPTRTVTWQANDGSAANNLSVPVATTILLPVTTFGGSGDFDGDGDNNGDLLWQNPDGLVVAWDMNGAQIASTKTLGVMPLNWHVIGTGHFSGGSINTDVLFRSDHGDVVVWQTSGGHVSVNQFLGQLPSNWHFAGIADVNADGKSDVLWHSDNNAVVVWEMDGAHVVLDQQVGEVPRNWHFAGTGDFNNDGKSDVVWQSDAGGIVLWEMNGAHVQVDQFLGQVPSNWHFAAVGDFNGDGKSDMIFHSDAGAVVMWQMNGTQILANVQVGQVPPNWHISGTADVNGDGKSDVIWTSDAGDHLVWEMNGTQVMSDQLIGPNAAPASPPQGAHADVTNTAAADPSAALPGTLGGIAHDPHFLV